MINDGFAEGLNAGKMIIVLASEGDIDPETKEKVAFNKDKEPYQVGVLSQAWLSIPDLTTGSVNAFKLDGRILHFRREHRPKKRYLWFLAIMIIARRHRCRVTGSHEDVEILGSANWDTPGECLRKSTMLSIVHRIALVDSVEAEEMLKLGPTLMGDAEETWIDREICDRVTVWLNPPRVDGELDAKNNRFADLQMIHGAD
jgi:hypothetical protein